MKPTAGKLDRRIVLQTAALSQDEDGAPISTWPPDGGVALPLWAQWLPGGTRESYQAQQRLEAYIDGVYRMYDVAEPKPDVSRIIGHDGRTYDVKPATELGYRNGWDVPVVAHGE